MNTTPTFASSGPQLITYADRLGGTFTRLQQLLDTDLAGVFDGVHVLPFFTPFDGEDAGFDPKDHTLVDPRLGSWDDVRALSSGYTVMTDLIVNHVSVHSPQFQDVIAHGDDSPWADMFLTLSSIWPEGVTEEELAAIYRPRPGLPFTAMRLGDTRRLVWTTFTPAQIDIDVRSQVAWDYLTGVIDTLTSAGVTLLRLDAVGYTGKAPGTSCFMTPQSDALVSRIRDYAHARGARVLLEIHGHYEQQLAAAKTVDMVYDFALPPLVIHTLMSGNTDALAGWLKVRPSNTVTVLDTHDGIGIIDVGPANGRPGLMEAHEIDSLVETIHEASRGTSRLATGTSASNVDLYQVNCTFFDALGADVDRYLTARLLQLFVPGIPQVYYVGLLLGQNDLALLERSRVGRDINRHYYDPDEVSAALATPPVRAQVEAIRLRREHAAFHGEHRWSADGSSLRLEWHASGSWIALDVDASMGRCEVQCGNGSNIVARADATDADGLAALPRS